MRDRSRRIEAALRTNAAPSDQSSGSYKVSNFAALIA